MGYRWPVHLRCLRAWDSGGTCGWLPPGLPDMAYLIFSFTTSFKIQGCLCGRPASAGQSTFLSEFSWHFSSFSIPDSRWQRRITKIKLNPT